MQLTKGDIYDIHNAYGEVKKFKYLGYAYEEKTNGTKKFVFSDDGRYFCTAKPKVDFDYTSGFIDTYLEIEDQAWSYKKLHLGPIK